MKLLWIAVILHLSLVYANNTCCEEYCFGQDKERRQTLQFTSKTAYQIAKGSDPEQAIPKCSPTKIWMVSRHGTRLPSANTIKRASELEALRDQITQNYKVLKTKPETGALCLEDLFSIQTWKFNSSITPEMENYLTTQGWEDLKLLAKYYQRYYPDILSKDYSPQNFLFRHTNIQRTEESFKAFSEGLFGPDVYKNVYLTKSDGNDTLLRPYDYCSIWNDNNNEKDNSTEFMKFRYTEIMTKTISDISRRLGFQYPLEFKSIELMWDMCRYEQAWNLDRTSAWCGAFTPAQLTVLEYYDDLRYYKKSGYGHDVNAHLPCELVKDMLFQLNSKTKPNAIVYFGHSTAIQTLITALGLKKDSTAPTSSNYNSMGDRMWKTSVMDPFASNLVAVKYECPNETEKDKVMFYLNQKHVDLDWCKVGLCNWSDVMKQYQHFYDANCTEYYCRTGGAGLAKVSLMSFLIAAIVYLIY